jgi:hypothetical protein
MDKPQEPEVWTSSKTVEWCLRNQDLHASPHDALRERDVGRTVEVRKFTVWASLTFRHRQLAECCLCSPAVLPAAVLPWIRSTGKWQTKPESILPLFSLLASSDRLFRAVDTGICR